MDTISRLNFGKKHLKTEKKMNKTENNRLIAEFMGLSYCKKHLYTGWYKNHKHNERICDFDGLKYHRDWNQLMEVVVKCKENQIFGSQNLITEIDNALIETTIENVYCRCIEFIKFYNN